MKAARTLRVGVMTTRPIAGWQADATEELAAIPGVTIAFRREGQHAAGDPPIGRARVDVLLNMTAVDVGLPVWAGEVWHFGYGPQLLRDVRRAAIIDYVRGARLARVALIRANDGMILRHGWLQVRSWWRGEHVSHLLTDPCGWPAAVARQRLNPVSDEDSGPDEVSGPGTREPEASTNDRWSMPLLITAAAGRRIIGMAATVRHHPDWNIGIVDAPIDWALSGDSPPITWLPTRPGHYAADPFAIEQDGRLDILYEDFDQRAGIGTIHHVSVGQDGRTSDPEAVLDTGVHTSYPFLIREHGSIFLLPETSAAEELVLYQAETFPNRWRRVATLLVGIPAVDASVVWHEDRWWMFATRTDRGDNHALFIWHAPDLVGPWLPHLGNPVKIDVRSARPGGTPFFFDGSLYRPSQDSSRLYGSGLSINRVEVLTPQVFRERPVARVAPAPGSPYADGLHTLSAAGRRTLVDGNSVHLVPEALARTVGWKLRSRTSRLDPTGLTSRGARKGGGAASDG